MSSRSPLAVAIHGADGADHGARTREVYGVVVHTTGGGVIPKAKEWGVSPLECATRIYADGPNAGHYLIGYEGEVLQIVPDDRVAWHVGRFGPGHEDRRADYLSGRWRSICPPEAVAAWDRKWSPKYKSPQHLFPGSSANDVYVGVELLQCGEGHGTPSHQSGGIFTEAQYVALLALARDIAQRHELPSNWARTTRLLGHEDLGLIDRSNRGGGWDPGYLRSSPTFDFLRVRAALSGPQA